MIYESVCIVIVIIMILCGIYYNTKEGFCGTTGLHYGEGEKLPQITNDEPPFYDLNAARQPKCSYKNFTFPPPMDYGPPSCPYIEPRYHYWDTAMLSHPQTPYLV